MSKDVRSPKLLKTKTKHGKATDILNNTIVFLAT